VEKLITYFGMPDMKPVCFIRFGGFISSDTGSNRWRNDKKDFKLLAAVFAK
jgi:hypothetical protein